MPPQRRRRTRRQNNNVEEEEEELSVRPPPAVSTRRGRSRSRSPHQGNVRERNGNVRQRRVNESARGLLENVRQRNENGANVTISISVPNSGVQTASNDMAGEDVNREPYESEDDYILVSNSDSNDGGGTRSYEVNLALDLSVPLSHISDFSEIDLPRSSTQTSPPTSSFWSDITDVIRDTSARVGARVLESLAIDDVIRQTTITYDGDVYVYSSSENELSDSESNTSNSEESPSAAAADDQRRRRFCLSEHVQEMPDVTVGGADMGSRCGVCIEDFEMGERDVIRLPCSHLHHRECFQQWVVRDKRSCPVCRQDVARELQEAAATGAAHSS